MRDAKQVKWSDMRRIVFLITLSIVLIGVMALICSIQVGEALMPSELGWSKTYGGAGRDEAYSVIQTADGGYAIAGYTRSFGSGDLDSWLVKTDANGNMQWNKTYGGTDYDRAYCLIRAADGGYAIAGATESYGSGDNDFWLVKTDANGNPQWNKTYAGKSWPNAISISDHAYSVVQTVDGGYALAGITDAYPFVVTSWLVKTDVSGNAQWNKTLDEGYYNGTVHSIYENIVCEVYCLVQTTDGGYTLAGATCHHSVGYLDFWLVKTDENGAVPEFPSFLILPLFIATTILAAIFLEKRKHLDSVHH
jgi:hypothetical protein